MTHAESRGQFVWFDLMTSDPDAAISFYTDLIGWGTAQWEGDTPYTMWTAGDTRIGGVVAMPEEARKGGAPPHWLGYIATEDVDKTIVKAKGLGARVLVPGTDIPSVGRFAVMADPQGAAVAVFAPENDMPLPEDRQNGSMSWHELGTSDLESAWSFYSSVFGWSKTEDMDMGEAGIYRIFSKAGPPMGGIFNKPPQMPSSAWMFYIHVADADAGAAQVKRLGGEVVNGPMEVPDGSRIVQCMDPQGAAFALHSG